MQLRPERHLRRRQNTLAFILQDILYQAFARAHQVCRGGGRGPLPDPNYSELFSVSVADVSRSDNKELAQAGQALAAAFSAMFVHVPPAGSKTLVRKGLELLFKFVGEPLTEKELKVMTDELEGKTLEQPADELAAAEDDQIGERNGRVYDLAMVQGNGRVLYENESPSDEHPFEII
jgi:hypothetical protein